METIEKRMLSAQLKLELYDLFSCASMLFPLKLMVCSKKTQLSLIVCLPLSTHTCKASQQQFSLNNNDTIEYLHRFNRNIKQFYETHSRKELNLGSPSLCCPLGVQLHLLALRQTWHVDRVFPVTWACSEDEVNFFFCRECCGLTETRKEAVM